MSEIIKRVDGHFEEAEDGVKWVSGYVSVKCDCGETVTCEGFTSTCDTCGADYNGNGQRLAPRSQWGEETGESLSDIFGPDDL